MGPTERRVRAGQAGRMVKGGANGKEGEGWGKQEG